MGRKLKLYLKMVDKHLEDYDRNEHRRATKANWQARRRLEHPQEAKEQARRDWYVRSCRMAGIEPSDFPVALQRSCSVGASNQT